MLQNYTGIPTLLMERDAHSLKIFKQGFVDVGFHPANDEVRDACMTEKKQHALTVFLTCLLYTSPSPRDLVISRMPSSA